MLIFFSLSIIFIGLVYFSLNRKHLLLLLLSLEFLVIRIYFNLVRFLRFYSYEFFFLIIFLTIMVCERALGLSVLVRVIRTHGNDYFNVFRFL